VDWALIDDMVSQLGDLYALEVEAAGFPEIAEERAVQEVRLAVLRATDAMSRIGNGSAGSGLEAAREALAGASASASVARRILAEARAARNRHP
jgi:hypothetical protein